LLVTFALPLVDLAGLGFSGTRPGPLSRFDIHVIDERLGPSRRQGRGGSGFGKLPPFRGGRRSWPGTKLEVVTGSLIVSKGCVHIIMTYLSSLTSSVSSKGKERRIRSLMITISRVGTVVGRISDITDVGLGLDLVGSLITVRVVIDEFTIGRGRFAT
jgi:hypothetical protein